MLSCYSILLLYEWARIWTVCCSNWCCTVCIVPCHQGPHVHLQQNYSMCKQLLSPVNTRKDWEWLLQLVQRSVESSPQRILWEIFWLGLWAWPKLLRSLISIPTTGIWPWQYANLGLLDLWSPSCVTGCLRFLERMAHHQLLRSKGMVWKGYSDLQP